MAIELTDKEAKSVLNLIRNIKDVLKPQGMKPTESMEDLQRKLEKELKGIK